MKPATKIRKVMREFKEGSALYDNYIPYQPPYLSGIEVV